MALITITKSIFTRSNQYFIKTNLIKNKFFKTSCSNNAVIPFKLSDIGEGIREVQIKEWFIKEGERISQFDNICEVQSDKASVTITSRYDGVVQKICHGIDDMVLVGDTLIQIDTDNESSQEVTSSLSSDKNDQQVASALPETSNVQSTTTFTSPSSSSLEQEILTIPKVRKLAKDMQVDLATIKGSGKDGRILKEDILSSSKIVDNLLNEDKNRIITIKGYQKAMFKTMTESMKIPHFVYSDEIKLTNLVKLRQHVKTELLNDKNKLQTIDKNVIKQLTFMPFMLKAISLSLLEYPILNSSIIDNEKILLKSDHNIGVAMDTSDGLVVPNIKSVQTKSILEIGKELLRLQELGSKTSFSTRDLSEGTFALSNIGVIGGTYTKPCILPPNVAIGAIGQIQRLPRFNENNEVIGEHIMQVSWAADHRIIDGVTMAKFSNLFKYYLEHPNILLLNI